MIPLSLAPKGGALTIGLIKGKDETKRFLENLGFVQGGSVTVITEIDGNMIVKGKDRWKMKSLKDAKIGETVKVTKLGGDGAVKRRIMDMGITKGAEIFIRKVAPLGDPIEVKGRGYELSLRKADAQYIEVE